MAGTHHILKPGQVLFKAGDKSDGMYIIRRGELKVFLEKEGREVELAKLVEGGIVGEMALFDQKPRSASVKAVKETEVSHITSSDFDKLMKQIPKWFVTLMSSLSARLRQTNERLQTQEMEARSTEGVAGRMQALKRMLNILSLVVSQHASKEGKDWTMGRQAIEDTLVEQFGESAERVKLLLDTLVRSSVLIAPKPGVLGIPNRASLTQIIQSLHLHTKTFPGVACLSDAQRGIMTVLEKMAQSSPYDSLTASLDDIQTEARKMGLNPQNWNDAAQVFARTGEDIKLVKTSGGEGLRIRKKEFVSFVRFHTLLAAFQQAKLT